MEDGDEIDLDGEILKVVSTPGHTKGSVCFVSEQSKAGLYGRYGVQCGFGKNGS